MNYTPDAWTIVKLTNEGKVHYRVYAGWYGGYTGSDSWKMNSGITKIEDAGEYYNIFGQSGSCYHCHKTAERMTGYMWSVFSSFASQNNEKFSIEVIDFSELPEF